MPEMPEGTNIYLIKRDIAPENIPRFGIGVRSRIAGPGS